MHGMITIEYDRRSIGLRGVVLNKDTTEDDLKWLVDDDDAKVTVEFHQGRIRVRVESNKLDPKVGSHLGATVPVWCSDVLTPLGMAWETEKGSFIPIVDAELPASLNEFE